MACGKYPGIQPDTVLLYDKVRKYRVLGPVTKDEHFWHRSRTLLFTYPGGRHPSYVLNEQTPTHVFENLINLKLDIIEDSTIDWINETWSMPKLRMLSIKTSSTADWSKLLVRLRLTLEEVELLTYPGLADRFTPFEISDTIIMPKLNSMCLTLPNRSEGEESVELWFSQIRAPQLHKFSFHIHYITALMNNSDYLRMKLDTAIRTYPIIKEVGVFFHGGKNLLDPEMYDRVRIMADIDFSGCYIRGIRVVVRRPHEQALVYSP